MSGLGCEAIRKPDSFIDHRKGKGPESSGPSMGDVAERSNASDSKSEEPSSSKNSAGSVGSNPTISALHRNKEKLLSGSNLFDPITPPKRTF